MNLPKEPLMYRRLIILTLVAAALGGCSSGSSASSGGSGGGGEGTPVNGGTLRAGIPDNPDHLDTGIAFAVEGWQLLRYDRHRRKRIPPLPERAPLGSTFDSGIGDRNVPGNRRIERRNNRHPYPLRFSLGSHRIVL